MSSFIFERPVGAAADARELEYITALHQTQHDEDDTWMDGSIEATDVKNYLLSRYGIKVTKREVRKLIFADMGGGDDTDECIDITEVVAILLIPFFAKIERIHHEDNLKHFQSKFEFDAYEKSQEVHAKMIAEDETILSDVLQSILRDAVRASNGEDSTSTSSSSSLLAQSTSDPRISRQQHTNYSSVSSQPLTKELLRRIFASYGEKELVEDDDLLDEMIESAADGDPNAELNIDTFLKGLTHDIGLYDVMNESKFQTHYEDVFGLASNFMKWDTKKEQTNAKAASGIKHVPPKDNRDIETFTNESTNGKIDHLNNDEKNQRIQRIFTFPQIDFLSDTFRSRAQYIFIWLACVWGYISWIFANGVSISVCKEENKDSFGCKILQSTVLWLVMMVSLITIMSPCVMIMSLGNNVYTHSIVEIISGMIGTVVIVIFPAIFKFKLFILSTKPNQPEDPGQDPDEIEAYLYKIAEIISFIIGGILLLFQFANLVRFIVPDSTLTRSKTLTTLLRGSSVRSEFGIKQASIMKVHQMVRNAHELHRQYAKLETAEGSSSKEDRSESEDPLLNFSKITERKETSGGFIWAWKEFWSGRLIEHEGVWLHTKLLVGNLAQFLITIVLTILLLLIGTYLIDIIYDEIDTAGEGLSEIADYSCFTSFNPENCIYPTDQNGASVGLAVCSEVYLSDPSCLYKFVEAEAARDLFCDAFETGVEQLPEPYNYLYSGEDCPNLIMPYPLDIYSYTPDSNETSYCASPLAACTPPEEYSTMFDVCVLGISVNQPIPFRFAGDLCSQHTELDSMLERKEAFDSSLDTAMPRRWMFHRCDYVGAVFVVILGIASSISTIPSMIITTLKFRTGVIPSLRDPYFKRYRVGLLKTTMLLGGAMWGTIVSAFMGFVSAFTVAFLIVYPITRPYIVTFLSLLLGVSVTLLLKIVISIILNKYNFVGYYRKRPLLANISNLCFECWHLAITSGFVVMRAVKLLVIIVIYVGRFDTPVLAKGVGEFGSVRLDPFPFIFRQDLLAIDAHRHPYIERLGMMYIMKLKHRENFAKKSGSIWRLLFVFALFPWLRKYRILNNDETDQLDESPSHKREMIFQSKIATLNAKVKQLTQMNKNLKGQDDASA